MLYVSDWSLLLNVFATLSLSLPTLLWSMEVNRLDKTTNRDEALHVTMSSGGRQMLIQNNQVGVFECKRDSISKTVRRIFV